MLMYNGRCMLRNMETATRNGLNGKWEKYTVLADHEVSSSASDAIIPPCMASTIDRYIADLKAPSLCSGKMFAHRTELRRVPIRGTGKRTYKKDGKAVEIFFKKKVEHDHCFDY